MKKSTILGLSVSLLILGGFLFNHYRMDIYEEIIRYEAGDIVDQSLQGFEVTGAGYGGKGIDNFSVMFVEDARDVKGVSYVVGADCFLWCSIQDVAQKSGTGDRQVISGEKLPRGWFDDLREKQNKKNTK